MGLRAVLKVMKPQGSGVIVNTASMAAIKGAATFSPYIASKHAVLGLTKSAALEGGAVRHPGQLRGARALRHPDGPRPDRTRSTRTTQTGVFRAVSESVPYGKRYGTAAEVANVVLWLLSDESEYVSGALHLIDGALNAG